MTTQDVTGTGDHDVPMGLAGGCVRGDVATPYTLDDYQRDALRTKSPIYEPGLVPHADLREALDSAIIAGQYMRTLKKACFGGKPYWPSIPMHEQTGNLDAISPDMLHAVMGILNEAGELAEKVRDAIFDGKPFPIDGDGGLVEEGGDSLWFWVLAFYAAGVNPTDVLRRNIAKLKTRFPDRFGGSPFDPSKLDDAGRDKAAETVALSGRTVTVHRHAGDREVPL